MARAQLQWTVEPLPLLQARLQSILEPVHEEADLETRELVHEWPVHEWPVVHSLRFASDQFLVSTLTSLLGPVRVAHRRRHITR